MSKCGNKCQLCDRFVISTAVTFTGGNLVINIPAGNYGDGCKYCIVVAQTIPATATINAPVYITIGSAATLYPVNRCDCSQATACAIRTRTKYAVRVVTTATGGSFRMTDRRVCCCAPTTLKSLPAPVAAAAGGDAE